MNKKICIIGTGGFGRETLCCVIDIFQKNKKDLKDEVCFMTDDEFFLETKVMGISVIPKSLFEPLLFDVIVAVGDPHKRKKIIENLPGNTTFSTLIHPSAVISKWVEIGEGSVVTAGCIITCNIKIGKHAHLNLYTTVGHDCEIGNYFTTAPGTNISGNCRFGDCVYFGTNSMVKQGVEICDNVTIGMGGVVVKNINEEGIYIGNPVKQMVKK